MCVSCFGQGWVLRIMDAENARKENACKDKRTLGERTRTGARRIRDAPKARVATIGPNWWGTPDRRQRPHNEAVVMARQAMPARNRQTRAYSP